MAAPRLLKTVRLCQVPGSAFIHQSSSSSPPEGKKTFLSFLNKYFNDVDTFLDWNTRWKYWKLKNSNERLERVEALYNKYAAAAYYTLSLKGGVRFLGDANWFRPNQKGHFNVDFLRYKDVPVECVDLSHSDVTYSGLDNLMELRELRYLNLSHCPHIDDFCLSRLYIFGRSLEVLVLAGCPQVTERGLASLHHLQNLKHLDISDLPKVANKGLTRILLEEVLPGCEIVGMEYTDGLQEKDITAQTEV